MSEGWAPVARALVDGSLLEVWLTEGGVVARVPRIAAGPDSRATPEVPERDLPFDGGILVTMAVAIKEENRLTGVGDERSVVGRCSWLVSANGVAVYGRALAASAPAALVEAAWAVDRLRLHAVHWWEESAWADRAVWHQGVPARVVGFRGSVGQAVLRAEPGFRFPLDATSLEVDDIETIGRGLETVNVDILLSPVAWTRIRGFETARNDLEREDQTADPVLPAGRADRSDRA